MGNIDKLDYVLLVGIEKGTGKLHIDTDKPNFAQTVRMLEKALFRINYIELVQEDEFFKQKAEQAEQKVKDAVNING